MSATHDDAPLLTVASIRELRDDLDADLRLQKELPRRIEQKRARLEAALMFAPESLRNEKASASDTRPKQTIKPQSKKTAPLPAKAKLKPAPATRIIKARNGKKTWTVTIMKALRQADTGLSHRDLRAAMEKLGMARRLESSDKGFYGGIAKLIHAGEVIKSGGLLYARGVAEALERQGALPDKTAESRQRGGTSALVLEVLRGFPTGLNGPQLQQLVAARPDAPKSLRDHRHYIYNVLATLVGAGQVMKVDGVYRLMVEKGETSGATNTAGFEAHASGVAR